MRKIPDGAEYQGNSSGRYYKVVRGRAYVWRQGSWEYTDRCEYLLGGRGVHTERGVMGYYKLTLEEIVEDFVQ